MAMKDHKLLIVADIQRAIEGINSMAVSLQHDTPLSSGTLPSCYAEATIYHFQVSSQTVVESLLSASTTTSSWLEQMGDKLSVISTRWPASKALGTLMGRLSD
ncbi:hypothetical protein GSI_08753 [Ganoderma sinense ZZ0214-1]|uniref:Uncharacterized protein n=1 Tax=Ganoderma sinense ZZ0214-1 TaxID=1077348 RepID=A0A2G8S4K6_9APHY|nr:hypothetical protein GSI_08753 [Ganoderma sinense ZZ0214-1]